MQQIGTEGVQGETRLSGHHSSQSAGLVEYTDFISAPLQKGPGISNDGYSPSIYPFDQVSATDFCLE